MNLSQKKKGLFREFNISCGAPFFLQMPKNASKMAFLNFFSPSWRPDHYYLSFGTFRDHKNPKKVPKNTKKRSSNFYPFSLREMTTIHKNSYKTNKKPLPTPPNTLKVFHIYIGRPQKKKNRKILTQGKSCFFIVNATNLFC